MPPSNIYLPFDKFTCPWMSLILRSLFAHLREECNEIKGSGLPKSTIYVIITCVDMPSGGRK